MTVINVSDSEVPSVTEQWWFYFSIVMFLLIIIICARLVFGAKISSSRLGLP